MSDRLPLTYLSFAAEDRFLGGLILDGELDPITAVKTAWAKKLNPGGEVLVIAVPPDCPEPDYQAMLARRDRLLSMEEVERMQDGKTVGELLDEGAVDVEVLTAPLRIDEEENRS
jgi:hypothetical protein